MASMVSTLPSSTSIARTRETTTTSSVFPYTYTDEVGFDSRLLAKSYLVTTGRYTRDFPSTKK